MKNSEKNEIRDCGRDGIQLRRNKKKLIADSVVTMPSDVKILPQSSSNTVKKQRCSDEIPPDYHVTRVACKPNNFDHLSKLLLMYNIMDICREEKRELVRFFSASKTKWGSIWSESLLVNIRFRRM